MKVEIDTLWKRNRDYAQAQGLRRTLSALNTIQDSRLAPDTASQKEQAYLIHGLSIAWLLVELRLPVSAEELDVMLAASIIHIVAELYGETALGPEWAEEDVRQFVAKISEADQNPSICADDRLLLVVKLAERSNLIEHLCHMSDREAKQFMQEARRIWFSVCLEGKVRYPEFDAALTGILEKMRGLIQTADILYRRYDEEEDWLYAEILELKEENARIRYALEQRRGSL